MAALPFCHLTITAKKWQNPYRWKCTQVSQNEVHTIGDHIKRHRLKLRQFQYELADRFHVTLATIQNWENNRFPPHQRQFPAILEWLGYDPRTP